ncbi:hypothetical protein ZEAMMB73_Zm00001d039797 [Zea mays]|uniref:Uncharacterized protein n=1 Tax=Zea mays TaxID=4577 RepID=A0A1D6ML71_MAIZE|nr:hypothetical protein ZEAMMB73_Zm00001d039797 [Zea mays]
MNRNIVYLHDYPTFAATARYWTEAFAKSASTGMEEKVQKLVEMGFPEDQVRSALNIAWMATRTWLSKSPALALGEPFSWGQYMSSCTFHSAC